MYENLLAFDKKYTPVEGKVRFTLDRLKAEFGTWSQIAAMSGMSRRNLRAIRKQRSAISERTLDQILSGCNTSVTVRDFQWYSPEQLVEMGVWKEPGGHEDLETQATEELASSDGV